VGHTMEIQQTELLFISIMKAAMEIEFITDHLAMKRKINLSELMDFLKTAGNKVGEPGRFKILNFIQTSLSFRDLFLAPSQVILKTGKGMEYGLQKLLFMGNPEKNGRKIAR